MSVGQMSMGLMSIDQAKCLSAKCLLAKCQWANCLSTNYHQSNAYWLSDAYGPNVSHQLIEQHTFKNVNNCLNTNISSYSETSGGQSSYLYLNVVHFFNTSVRHLQKLKTVIFLHRCLIFLLRDIWWSKFLSILKCCSFFQHQC